jgi:glycosyltransferase involved in cell wall biosynthesis
MSVGKPLVSIIIPNYNRENLIGDTIKSLINQTYSNWEAIIVDDGSTDRSIQVVEEFGRFDSRIKYFQRDTSPKGAPVCRNIGTEKANGEYIIFLDSDDLLAFWCLEERIKYVEQNPDLDFAVFPVLLFNNKAGDSNILWNIFNGINDLERFVGSDVPWQTTSPIWRKSTLLKLGSWDVEALSWQDWEYHIRALLKDFRYNKVDELPDAFIRRDSTTRISASNHNATKAAALKNLFIKIDNALLENRQEVKVLRKLLAGNFFIYAENIILYSIDLDYKSYFEVIKSRKMVSAASYRITLLYLCLLNTFCRRIPVVPGVLYRIGHKILPSFFINRESSFCSRALNSISYQKLLHKLDLKHNENTTNIV